MKNRRLHAERYAQAIAGAVGGVDALEEVRDDLFALAELVRQSDTLRRTLLNPAIPAGAKSKAVLAIAERLHARKTTLKFLALLGEREALSLLVEIAAAVARVVDRRRAIEEVVITAAAPLSPPVRDRLLAALQRGSKATFRLQEKVDPSLLGGLVVQIGGRVFDGSVRTRLEKMRERLAAGATASLGGS